VHTSKAIRLFVVVAPFVVACAGTTGTMDDSAWVDDAGATGGVPPGGGGYGGQGGYGVTGGFNPYGSGGAPGTGGTPGTGGGGPGTGGNPATGGAPGTGGSTGVGGVISDQCAHPSNRNPADLQSIWNKYVATFVTAAGALGARRVQRTENGNDTVSEGIGYGMIGAAYMGDCQLVSDLWDYSQKFPNDHGLMHWHISSGGSVAEQNGATDGDEDVAWGLLVAAKKCTGRDYTGLAKAQIQRIWQYEVLKPGDQGYDASKGYVLAPGDHWGPAEDKTNPSYFAPAYYRVFAQITGQSGWTQVVSTSYARIQGSMNGSTGLVPDWCKMSGGALGDYYGYDATRAPWRIGVDLCLNGAAEASSWLTKVGAFFSGVGGANIKAGYYLTGTTSVGYGNGSFTGPAAVAMMSSPSYASACNAAYTSLLSYDKDASISYYNASVGLMAMLVLNGAFAAP
jgi:endo-1,4-beta-D-glucanase Y